MGNTTFRGMTLNTYQELTGRTANCPATYLEDGRDYWSVPLYQTLGLAGEVGEAVNRVKKMCRDGGTGFLDKDQLNGLKLELGDVMWYLAQLSKEFGWTLEEVAVANIQKLEERYGRQKS